MLKTRSGDVITPSKWGSAPGGERFLRLAEVTHTTGLSRAHIYALAADGEFPKPIKISARASGWLESEVQSFMAARVAASRGAAA
jgi:prophage regulatory protein